MIFRIEWPLNETERANLGNVDQTWREREQLEQFRNIERKAKWEMMK